MDLSIPIIDISCITNTSMQVQDTLDESITSTAKSLQQAFKKYGFVYIKGHNIPQQLIKSINEHSRDFFNLPELEKHSHLYKHTKLNFCYIPSKCEVFDTSSEIDLKEVFDFIPTGDSKLRSTIPKLFYEKLEEIFTLCKSLSIQLLDLLNLAFISKERSSVLKNYHSNIGDINKNWSTLRCLNYPSLYEDGKKGTSQYRCSEHSDYGSLTLLFQDDTGGLQVETENSYFIDVPPIKDTIVVNAADLLERWTDGEVKSARHRVIFLHNNKQRQCIAFFCQPNNNVTVEPLTGCSSKYMPVNTLEYLNSKFNITYRE